MSSSEAVVSYCWAMSAHGPHIRTHSCRKTGRQAVQCTNRACGVPRCVSQQSSQLILVFSRGGGGGHPCQRTLPQSH